MKRRARRPDPLFDAVAEGRPIPQGRLDEVEDVEALRAAIELRAGVPAADLPSESFVTALRARMAQEASQPAERGMTRRSLLTAAAAVAGGAVAAGAAGAALDRAVLSPGTTRRAAAAGELIPADGQWTAVATNADLAGGATQRFNAGGVIGYVSATDGGVVAVSAACTHQGCILEHNAVAGRLDCPCHRTAFGVDGRLLFSQLASQPAPLTRLQARQREGQVEVLVPRTV
jgi:nitrite reductase/ring-hydroxylating ferredoxin subunit